MMSPPSLTVTAIPGLPLVQAGDDLAGIIARSLEASGIALEADDILVVAQKIVSKAEGRLVDLATVTPSAAAIELAPQVDKDPRLVEVILSESRRVVRSRPGLMIVEHRLGFVMANAGVDRSNVVPGNADHAGGSVEDVGTVLLLPRDPDASALALRSRLAASHGVEVGIIISDSFGRPWRRGTAGVAIGLAGIPALLDLRGQPDLFGRELQVTETGFADEIAAAASLLMGQAAEGLPLALVRGLDWRRAPGWDGEAQSAAALVRPPEHDLFR